MVARVVLSQEPLQLSLPYSDESDQPNPYMQMDGKAIFDFAVKTVSKSIKALVEEKVSLITSFFIKLIFVF